MPQAVVCLLLVQTGMLATWHAGRVVVPLAPSHHHLPTPHPSPPHCLTQIEDLRTRVVTNARPKTLYGRPLTGAMLARLACEYCRAMNDNQTPTIRSAWDRVADQQCEEAVEKAVAL